MIAIVLAMAALSAQADTKAICALREVSNDGIVARDAQRAVAPMSPGVRVITSGSTLIEGAEAMRAAFTRNFADPAFVALRRRPDMIRVAGSIAAEHGSWHSVRRDRTVDGEYLIRWERAADGWRTVSELYIPLAVDAAPVSPARSQDGHSPGPCG